MYERYKENMRVMLRYLKKKINKVSKSEERKNGDKIPKI